MFYRRMICLIILFILSMTLLIWKWQDPVRLALPFDGTAVSSNRWALDLTGSWDQFVSLRQAMAVEEQRINGSEVRFSYLNGKGMELPSNAPFTVAAKRFTIPGEWSARMSTLEFSGVSGHVKVYLNGIGGENLLGEFDGSGTVDRVNVFPAGLRYGSENVLILQMQSSSRQQEIAGSIPWPSEGKITGKIALTGASETSLTLPVISIQWQDNNAEVTVRTQLQHRSLTEFGPWEVSAALLKGTEMVAETFQVVQAEERDSQEVELKLAVPQTHQWSPQDPFLYQLRLTLNNAMGDQDDLSLPVGLRKLDDNNDSWILNGQALAVNGTALAPGQEQTLRAEGQAEPWLLDQKAKGINLVYFSGSFPDELWLQTADRLGMGIWVEWPVTMVPGIRLPDPEGFRQLLDVGGRHPSIWAWTAGKALDESALATQEYKRKAAELSQGQMIFFMGKQLLKSNEAFVGSWGSILPAEGIKEVNQSARGWPQEKTAAISWAVLALVIFFMNIRSVGWRYREINENKPKRALREAWFWQGLALQIRMGTLAGVITSALFRLPSGFSPWFPDLWPVLQHIQRQNPVLIWLVLSLLFTLLRMLQIGSAAPHLPGRPRPLGLAFWLERRYFWAVIVAFLWAASFWGVPFYAAPLAYGVLLLLFLPVRIRDIRRAGGHSRLLMLLPGIAFIILAIMLLSRWTDWIFAIHLWQGL